ncbi:hypothetical protein ACFFQF_17260 [Haladaptatus pallidirubidus]|uniref:DUF7344 domain-containing protein n=2 Tax=Haladaptatus pallidirubidus TaxID=1008152 RepID=A0AAV3UR93_9EURY|nr:hypothetical protein [Haladaptatus pallidirubidus]
MKTDGGDQEHKIALHHVHLPRLEDHGIIVWNREAEAVTKGPQFDEIEPLLEVLTETHSMPPTGVPD